MHPQFWQPKVPERLNNSLISALRRSHRGVVTLIAGVASATAMCMTAPTPKCHDVGEPVFDLARVDTAIQPLGSPPSLTIRNVCGRILRWPVWKEHNVLFRGDRTVAQSLAKE
jgi:hypothetical protein